jgi:hypothetical protein
VVTSGALVFGGGAAITESAKDAEWLRLPLIPINVIDALPAAALDEAASITLWDWPADKCRDAGVAVTPVGSPLTATATVPLNEFTAAASTVTCALAAPAWITTEPGDADREKSGLFVSIDFDPAHEYKSSSKTTPVMPIRSRINRSRT